MVGIVANIETHSGKRTQAERSQISDQRMFEATVHLVVQKGPAGTSLKEVGELAGYSRGLASHRFGSKEKLFSYVLKRLGEMWLQQLKAVTDGKVGIEAIESAVEQHYRFCADAPEYVQTFYKLWFESVNAGEEIRRTIVDIHERRRSDVAAWIDKAPQIESSVKANADDIAAQFCASIIGIVYYWLANPKEKDEIIRQHLKLVATMRKLLRD